MSQGVRLKCQRKNIREPNKILNYELAIARLTKITVSPAKNSIRYRSYTDPLTNIAILSPKRVQMGWQTT